MTSNSSSRMPSASSTSPSVTGHSTPDIRGQREERLDNETPGIRKAMML